MDKSIRIPTSTYRIQLNSQFTFEHLVSIIPYLHDIGISDVYCSPFFLAAPGSTHGYDVCDQNEISPEIGGMPGLMKVDQELKARGMGLLLDFVPNHMGIEGPHNWRWLDVLENGRESAYADFFDIHWNPPHASAHERILVPMLHDFYGRVLESGDIRLEYHRGSIRVCYRSLRFPLRPLSYGQVLQRLAWFKDPASPVSQKIGKLGDQFKGLLPLAEAEPAQIKAERRKLVSDLRKELTALLQEAGLLDDLQQVLTDLNGKPGDTSSFDTLHEILELQHYRLAYWKSGIHEINYRRFFAVDTLVGLNMESIEVFADTHKLLKELLAKDVVTGVRIDHIDGLWDPAEYLQRLSELVPGEKRPLYVLVEKILTEGETLPPEWAAHGTSGYDFASSMINLLIPLENEAAFNAVYGEFLGSVLSPIDLGRQLKLFIMEEMFPNVIKSLAETLVSEVKTDRLWRDWTSDDLRRAISQIVASFPVYRTYRRIGEIPTAADISVVERAVDLTLNRNPGADPKPFLFVRDLLVGRYPDPSLSAEQRKWADEWVCKLQQYTGAIMAKSMEDTFFYRYVRLFSANEVGHQPTEFGQSLAQFHRGNSERRQFWPTSMLTTSTHDTKTSEDTRTRLLALSGVPDEWRRLVREWREANREFKTTVAGAQAPDANEEYLLYQILLGAWPLQNDAVNTFRDRIKAYMRKAMSEAKANTHWAVPNEPWMEASDTFIEALLDPKRARAFMDTFVPFAEEIAWRGMIFSLTQTVLKLTVPGVPDIYQGCELWDFSLVDPDNRRPVHYDRGRSALDGLEKSSLSNLLESWKDGRVKLHLIRTLLRHRRSFPKLFSDGSYTPLPLEGKASEQWVAFHRKEGADEFMVVATVRLGGHHLAELGEGATVTLPGNGAWHDLLSTRTITAKGGKLGLDYLLGEFPLSVFARCHST